MPHIVDIVEVEENAVGVELPGGGGCSFPARGVLHEEVNGARPSDASDKDVDQRHQLEALFAAKLEARKRVVKGSDVFQIGIQNCANDKIYVT